MKQILCVLPFLILACAGTGSITTPVEDISRYSQDPRTYAANLPDTLLISSAQQEQFLTQLKENYFRVWSETSLTDSATAQAIISYFESIFAKFEKDPGFDESFHQRDTSDIKTLLQNASLPKQFDHRRRGIMTTTGSLRSLPTEKPYFRDFSLPGEGFPFDYWQISTIPVGTPIEICHESANWALISSHIASGWVRRTEFAQIDDSVAAIYQSLPLVSIVADETPLYRTNGSYAFSADIGTIFPVIAESDSAITALVPTKNSTGTASLDTIAISRTSGKPIPQPLTANNIADLSAKMIGQNYGWGGLFGNRDCSQTLQELFISFGILLPRNSKFQAYNSGRFIPIAADSPEQVKESIRREGIPFVTLIRSPGHIMLYLGTENNEPIIFHSTWGTKTERFGREGRLVIGKTVITSLEAGKELRYVNKKRNWLNTIEGITILTQPK